MKGFYIYTHKYVYIYKILYIFFPKGLLCYVLYFVAIPFKLGTQSFSFKYGLRYKNTLSGIATYNASGTLSE